MSASKKAFKLRLVKPFTTFVAGEPAQIPYVIHGLLTMAASAF